MKKLLPLLALAGCGNPDIEAERDMLTERVGTLERELEQVTQQKEALDRRVTDLQAKLKTQQSDQQAEVERLQGELNTLTKGEIFRLLGIADGDDLSAVLETSMGNIECELFPSEAPKTVLNFVLLSEGKKPWSDPRTREWTERPLYENVIFHRVIPGFMIIFYIILEK